MENAKRELVSRTPEVILPKSQEPEAAKLVDIMAEQAAVMDPGERREMLVFMRGLKVGRELGAHAV